MISDNRLILLLAIVIPLALLQGAWIFFDARRRKERYYWLWGIFGLMNIPSSLLIYLCVTRVISRILKNKKKE